MKAGFVALIGRPNAGKSTLLNRLVGQKVAIVSDKPQTTRHRILGVQTTVDSQVAYVDTPGIHKPMHRMNARMVDAAVSAIRDVDLVVLLVDASSPPGPGDRYVLDLVASAATPAILALNKIDIVKKHSLLPLMASYSQALAFKAIVPISAATGDGVDDLTREVLAGLSEGEALFSPEYFTDQTERRLTAELIREKVLLHTRDELPYTTAVVIDQFEEPDREGGMRRIYASILVDHDSQKPIVVGKGGAMIKRIGVDARRDLETMLDGHVHLDLRVKVRQDWRDDERLLDELGLGPR